MTHYGILCPGTTGPLNTMLPLGQELQKRGHRVTLCGEIDIQSKVQAAGIEFIALSEKEFPPGYTAKLSTELGELRGLAALKYTVGMLRDMAAVKLRDAPGLLKEAGVEGLIVNQGSIEGGTVADIMDIPFVTVCSALVLN